MFTDQSDYLATDPIDDLNGDRDSDILFRNANGAYASWQLTGHSPSVSRRRRLATPGPAPVDGQYAGITGDGARPAFCTLNTTTGQIVAWQMNGTAIAATLALGNPGGSWKVVGTGDFNGDGYADILFRDASGNLATWDMKGGQIVGGGAIGNPGAGWKFVGDGDFNGDGDTDLLFENASGAYATWLLNDTRIVGGATLGAAGRPISC